MTANLILKFSFSLVVYICVTYSKFKNAWNCIDWQPFTLWLQVNIILYLAFDYMYIFFMSWCLISKMQSLISCWLIIGLSYSVAGNILFFFLPCIIDLIIDSGILKFFFAKVVFCELTYGSDGLRGKLVCSNLPALAAKWKMLFVRNIRNSVAYFVVYSTV